MTFMHIRDQVLPKHALGERRFDLVTAENVHDALRARGSQTAAQALEHQQVSLAVALRVLVEPARRRKPVAVVADTALQRASSAHCAGFPDFVEIAG